jgi:hypothetical protein
LQNGDEDEEKAANEKSTALVNSNVVASEKTNDIKKKKDQVRTSTAKRHTSHPWSLPLSQKVIFVKWPIATRKEKTSSGA